jgi:hypothetical protein
VANMPRRDARTHAENVPLERDVSRRRTRPICKRLPERNRNALSTT